MPTARTRVLSTRRNDAATYAQDVQFQSKGMASPLRPAEHRPGYAFQVLLLSAMVTASNLRRINSWIKKRNEPAQEPTKPLHATRKNASPGLQSHRPPANV